MWINIKWTNLRKIYKYPNFYIESKSANIIKNIINKSIKKILKV